MSTIPDLTVVEFATQHADECTCGTERSRHIRSHVDLLIETAVIHGKTLWRVGVDGEGRVSLIWLPQPEAEWRMLLAQAAEVVALKSALGIN